jgi:hypothetical protein
MNRETTSTLRKRFWKQLLEKSNKKTDLFLGKKPIADAWIETAVSEEKVGVKGIAYEYVISFRPAETRVQLKINVTGRDRDKNKAKNKRIYDTFHSEYEVIERDFGDILCWLRRDNHIYSRIAYIVTKNGLNDVSRWSGIQDKMVDAMIRFEQALSKHYEKIRAC